MQWKGVLKGLILNLVYVVSGVVFVASPKRVDLSLYFIESTSLYGRICVSRGHWLGIVAASYGEW